MTIKQKQKTFHICSVLKEGITASVIEYKPWNTTIVVQLNGMDQCKGDLEFSFAKAMTLSEVEFVSDNPSTYSVSIPRDLVDSYSSKRVLDNIWLRAVASSRHWVEIEPGPHGINFSFSEEVVRRRSEIVLSRDFFWIEDSLTGEQLVHAIMAEAKIESFGYTLQANELVVVDEEADFIYLRTKVVGPPGNLKVLGINSTSIWPRSDGRNDGVVFTIELEERAPHEEDWDSYLRGVVCQLRRPSGDTLLSPAVYRGDYHNLVCILGGGELGSIPEEFELTLSHYSGFNQLYFPILHQESSQIPHVTLGTLSTEEVRYNSTLLEAMMQQQLEELQSLQDSHRQQMFTQLSQLQFQASLLYEYAKSFLIVKIKLQASVPSDLLLRFHDRIEQRDIRVHLSDGQAPAVILSECSLLVISGSLQDLSIGCHVKDRQLQREKNYSVTLVYQGLGAIETNQTVHLAPHAQEVLRFDVTPKALLLSKATSERTRLRFNLQLLNKNLHTKVSAALGGAIDKFSGSFKYCLLDTLRADMIPLHLPENDVAAFECEFGDVSSITKLSVDILARAGVKLAVVDTAGHEVFHTTIKVAVEPAITNINPGVIIEYAMSTQRFTLETKDLTFFEEFEVYARLQNETFRVQTNGPNVYFEMPKKSLSKDLIGENVKTNGIQLRLMLNEHVFTPDAQELTCYRTGSANLISLSHHVLTSKLGQDLVVEASFLGLDPHLELVVIRAKLEDGLMAQNEVSGSRNYLALRPLKIHNDTHATFKVPSGMRSGIYAVSIKQGAIISAQIQYVLIMQQQIGEVYVESTEPRDLILTDGFNGLFNITLKQQSAFSHYELPLIRQLASGSIPQLQSLRLGCHFVFNDTNLGSCPGAEAIQASDTNLTCKIDLRGCQGHNRQQGVGPYLFGNMLFTLNNERETRTSSVLIKSPPVKLALQPRLINSPGRFALPLGVDVNLQLEIQNLIPGRTFCKISDLASMVQSDGSCHFGADQLTKLSETGRRFVLLISNNINENWFDENWYDTEIEVDLLDTPFYKSDALLQIIEQKFMFHNREAALVIRAKSSQQALQVLEYERYPELAAVCRLYDLEVSSITPRFETEDCGFTSGYLEMVQMKVPAGLLKAGTYHFQMSLGKQIASQIYEGDSLRVLYAPRLSSVYPRYLDLRTFSDSGDIYLLGLDFLSLKELEGSLRCFLAIEYDGKAIGSFLASNSRRAQILSDHVIKCPLSRATARNLDQYSAMLGLRVRPSLALSQANQRYEIDLLATEQSKAESYFELSQPITIYDPLQSRTSKYSAAELASADTSLRTIDLHCSPSSIFDSVQDIAQTIKVSLVCEFSTDEQFGGEDTTFTGQALSIQPTGTAVPSGLRPQLIKCGLPKMEMQTQWLNIRIRFTLRPDDAVQERLSAAFSSMGDFPSYTFIALNSVKLRVLELPYLSSVRPLTLFNLATVTSLTVTGHDFEQTGGALQCIIETGTGRQYKRTAIYTSSSLVTCPISPPPELLRDGELRIFISNDGGLTRSTNSLQIAAPASLPRITQLTSPRLIFANQPVDLIFQGTNLSSLGVKVLIKATSTQEVIFSCTVETTGTQMACYGAELPAPGTYRASIVGEYDADWGGSVGQPVKLTALDTPQIVGIYPESGDSALESIQFLFEDETVVRELIQIDRENNCCVSCPEPCRVQCLVYTPAQDLIEQTAIYVDGRPRCTLPTHNHQTISCSDEMMYLQINVVIDSYLIVANRHPYFGCLLDTVVDEPTQPFQVLYQQPDKPLEVQRVFINGSNFHIDRPGEESKCTFYNEEEDPVLQVPVAYRPALNVAQVHCLVSGQQLGKVGSGITYKVRYYQTLGNEYAPAYAVLVLERPRLLGVRTRLVSHTDEITLIGARFNSQVDYLCQYVEVGMSLADFYPSYAPATFVSSQIMTCPSLVDVPSYGKGSLPEVGYRCIEVRLLDSASGSLFVAEPGSLAKTAASFCVVTDIDQLVQQGPIYPQKLLLNVEETQSTERILTLPLVSLTLFEDLGIAPVIDLRFNNIVELGGGDLQLREIVDSHSDIVHEISCSTDEANVQLRCSPWPRVTSVIDGHSTSGLSLVLLAPFNAQVLSMADIGVMGDSSLTLVLDQAVEFFQNIQVETWLPEEVLLETIDRYITIHGQGFVDLAALQCILFETDGDQLVHLSTGQTKFESDIEVKCYLPEEIFASTGREVVLHLSLDGGLTYESMAGTMRWQILRAPNLSALEAKSALGEQSTLSQFVGRIPVLTLFVKGTHLSSAIAREPICSFDAGGGRVLQSEITILNDTTATCLAPAIPATRETGHQLIWKKLKVSLTLQADSSTFGYVESASSESNSGHVVSLLDFPQVGSLLIIHDGQRPQSEQASLDRASLLRLDPSTLVHFSLAMSDWSKYELAQLYGHNLKIVIVQSEGSTCHLYMDTQLSKVSDSGAHVTASATAQTLLDSLTANGEYRVGLSSWVEIALASDSTMGDTVSPDSPTFLFIDSNLIKFTTLPETTERMPTAPGLINHISLNIERDSSSGSLGLETSDIIRLLGCALISDSNSYYSDLTMSQEGWSEDGDGPIKIKFVFAPTSSIRFPGSYCVKMVLNNQLTDQTCREDSDPVVEIFHLPPSIYPRVGGPCDISTELANFPTLSRNWASQIALVNGRVQFEHEGGAVQCSFDHRVYDFLHQLFLLELSPTNKQWSLQDVLTSAIAQNISHEGLTSAAPSLPGQVYFRSHITDIWDPYYAPPSSEQIGLSGVHHPGEALTLQGYFLDNSPQGVLLRLTCLYDSAIVILSEVACRAKSQYETTCQIPASASFAAYGEFLVALEEAGTGLLLSDDHSSMVIILILPVPVIQTITPDDIVASTETGVNEAEPRILQLRIDFGWGDVLGTAELDLFKQNYLSQVRCRLGYLGPEVGKNLTWIPSQTTGKTQLACYFESAVHFQRPENWCAEVSINGGRLYTSDCPAVLSSTRAPRIFDFSPKLSLIADATTITISGLGFDSELRYWCLFTGPNSLDTLVEATYVDQNNIECSKPLITHTEDSHELEISAYFTPPWQDDAVDQLVSPLLVKRFDQRHANWAYARLVSVSPDRGDSLGGTPLVIELTNNPMGLKEENLECRFTTADGQSATGPLESVDEHHVNCLTPDFSSLFQASWDGISMQEVWLSISELDGTFRDRSALYFRYFRRPEISELWPDQGFATRATQVTLKGRYFVNFVDLSVRAVAELQGVTLVLQTWTDDRVLFMDTDHLLITMEGVHWPSGRGRPSNVRLEVSLNGGVDWATDPSELGMRPPFTFLDEPDIISMSHYWSNLRGSFNITLEILHLRFRSDCLTPAEQPACAKPADIAYCRMGLREAALTHINATHASCKVPAQAYDMTTPVTLKTIGGDYFGGYSWHEEAILSYSDDTAIFSCTPAEGPDSGGQSVVIGGNFTRIGDDELDIKFGGVPVLEIEERSASNITVRVGGVDLEEGEDRRRANITLWWVRTGLLFANDTVVYHYKNYSILTGIWPERGPSSGGTVIEVRGIDLDQESSCLLSSGDEQILIRPLWVSKETILCETSPHTAGLFSFELSFSSGSYITTSGLSFAFETDIHALEVSPSHVTLRAHDRGVRIGLKGLNFIDTPDFAVKIGGWLQPVKFVNTTFGIFSPPPVIEAGSYTIFVTSNGIDFSEASSNIVITYHDDFAVDGVSLYRIQQAESTTVDITVTGRGLPRSSDDVDFYCVFGPTETWRFTEVVIRASLISDDGTAIGCFGAPTAFETAPSQDLGRFNVSLRFTYDMQEFLWDQELDYFAPPRLTGIDPIRVTQSQSELVLTVLGDDLLDSGDELECRLEPHDPVDGTHIASLVVFQPNSAIQCTFGLAPRGTYTVVLSVNGVQFVSATDTPVQVVASLQILDVEPAAVQSRTSGQVVLVQVENLVDDCWCIFEHLSPAMAPHQQHQEVEHVTEGTRLGEQLLACEVPDLGGPGVSTVNLRISLDSGLRTRSQSAFKLRITDRCPPGLACQSGEVVECSPGHRCPGGSNDQPPRRCGIGFFQDQPGASTCKPCPRGAICPFAAIESPLPCPPGFSCSSQGLSSPESECPEGHYCLAGGQGAEPFLNGLLTSLSYTCSPGSYCRPGMKTGVVLVHTNSSAPAPCTQGMVCNEGSQEIGGIGPCPAGHFCPTPRHSGIPCPPRHYCSGRANAVPTKCPRGTFNMHFGQHNCTVCPLGRICPVEGLFLPELCPPGYACNQEGLVYPQNLCKIGHICLGGVMSGTLSSNRSCSILKTIGGYDQCPNAILYKVKLINEFSAQALPAYFFERNERGEGKVDACCWASEQVAQWFQAIGKAIGQERAFQSYRDQIKLAKGTTYDEWGLELLPMWDGMRLVDKAIFGHGLDPTDKLEMPQRRHREIIAFYSRLMYTSEQAQLCPGGLLCLDGVNTLEPGGDLASTPYPCPSGSYCLTGSDSVIGTALCPIGYYCPSQTTYPQSATPGFYTSNYGALLHQHCLPGSFQLEWRADGCDQCPAGYQCKAKGTSMPIICPVGYYRSVIKGIVCSLCPKGTFSFERGAKDPLECQECPPGRICGTDGASNVSSSVPCTDGLVCAPGSGAKEPVECPSGYYCPPETSEATKYDFRCGAGFFCRPGTGESTKTRDTCPQSYYCPPGTGTYNYADRYSDYSGWETDAPTRCPQGTGLDGEDRKNSLLNCTIDAQYRILNSGLNIRQAGTSSEDAAARRLQATQGDKRSLSAVNRGRQLIQAVASKSDPRLQDLFEVDFELGEAEDKPDIASGIRTYINLERQYAARWSPLKLELQSEFLEIEALDAEQLETNSPNAIFDLPPRSYALVTLDLRHLPEQDYDWTYGEDWAISFTLAENLTLGDISHPTPMPEQFLSRDQPKSQTMEFTVLAWRHLRLRVDILCYNSLYLNYRHLFMNTTSVEVRRPNRAVYGTDMTFAASIVNDYQITLPFNQPKLMADWSEPLISMPQDIVAFSQNPGADWVPIKHRPTKGRNVWVPTSLYWNSRVRINLPYLPYFSNCKGYGNFIPFWALMEQHYACTLVPREETRFMTQFSFGGSPTADLCEEVVINCVYDEVFVGQQPLPRWFEVDAGTPIFEVSTDPVTYHELMTKDFPEIEVLPVASPDNPGGQDQEVPKTVSFSIAYYQLDEDYKRLIQAGLDFADIEALSDDEVSGKVLVDYNLTFEFTAMSHRDLTIAFAFSWHFYLVLYVIVGVLSLFIMVAFTLYHRLVARPKDGQPIAEFKFFSFLALTIPPAGQGTGLALLPVLVADFLVACFVAAHVFQTDTHLFECLEPEGDVACPLTIFDVIKDDPGSVSVNYTLLRTGRCGTALLAVGLYLMRAGMTILIPDKTDLRQVPEAHDGNCWEYYGWKRSNMIFVSTFLSFLLLAIIQFSFSDLFGQRIWWSIAGLKVLGIMVDFSLEKTMEEALLVGPLSMCVIVILGLVTFGADDFLDFLNAFFIELGIMMFERTYLAEVVGMFFDYVQETLPKALEAIQSWFGNEDDGIVDDAAAGAGRKEGEAGETKKAGDGDGSEESSNSEVFYSEEDSANQAEDEQADEDPDLLLNRRADSAESKAGSGAQSADLQRMEDAEIDKADRERRQIKKKTGEGQEEAGAGGGSNGSEQKEEEEGSKEEEEEDQSSEKPKKPAGSEEEEDEEEQESADVDLDEDAEAEEVEPLIGEYAGYANDTLALLYTPIFVALLWMFYEETVVAKLYGIKVQDFVYYFLFSLVIAPAQIVIDICFLNIVEWYNYLPIHDYLDYMAYRFKTRKARWKGSEPFVNRQVAHELRSLDQLCFSSQHYFVQTLYVSGMTQVVLGIQVLLWAEGYNVFADLGTMPILLSSYALCALLERACLYCGKCLKIWKIDDSIERLEGIDESGDLGRLFRQLEAPRGIQSAGEAPGHVKFHTRQWRLVEQARIDEDQLKNELASDRVAAQTFRDIFLTYNKPWLQGQLHEVFTPRTLFLYRKDIIDQFAKVMGELAPDVSLSEELSDEDNKDQAEISSDSTDAAARKQKQKKAQGPAAAKVVAPEVTEDKVKALNIQVPTVAANVARYWLTRMRFIATLRVQVQSILELNLEEECLYCGATVGLNVELMQSIEDLFREFVVETGQKMPGWKFQHWIRYFKERARFRTLCVECAEMIEDYHHKRRRRARRRNQSHGTGNDGLGLTNAWASRTSLGASRPASTRRATPDPKSRAAAPPDPKLAASEREPHSNLRTLGPQHRRLVSHWIQLAKDSM